MPNSQLSTIARGSFTVIDYNDAASITAGITTNKNLTIVCSQDGSRRSEKWGNGDTVGGAASPCVINPLIYQSAVNEPIDVTAKLISMSWRYKTPQAQNWTDIQLERDSLGALTTDGEKGICTDKRFQILQQAQENLNGRKFALVIRCDDITGITSLIYPGANEAIDFEYNAIYQDDMGVQIPVSAKISFSILIQGESSTDVTIYTPNGNIFTNADDSATLSAIMEFWRGGQIDLSDIDFRWYQRKPEVFDPIAIKTGASDGSMVLSLKSKNDNIQVGSIFRITDQSNIDPDQIKNGTYQETGDQKYTFENNPHYYIVTAVNFSNAENLTINIARMQAVNNSQTGAEGYEVVNPTQGLYAAVTAGRCLVSRWWDYKEGGGWARIKATSLETSKAEQLGTSKGGAYLGAINRDSISINLNPSNINGSNTLMVPASGVQGIENYKGVAWDIDPLTGGENGVARRTTITFLDYSDPYQITCYSDQGNIIRNGSGYIEIIAEVRRGGELITAAEKANLIYSWHLMDRLGTEKDFIINDSVGDDGATGITGYGNQTYVIGWKNGMPYPKSTINEDDTSIAQADKVVSTSVAYDHVFLTKDDVVQKATATIELKM
jgi:hypothetical protein